MTTNNLMLVIRATNDAAKVLASVQDQLGLIVEAAQAANEAMAQIAETAAPAMAAASQAATAAQSAAVPAIDTQGMAAAMQTLNEGAMTSTGTEGVASLGEVFGTVKDQAVDFLTTLGGMRGGIHALQDIAGMAGNAMEGFGLRLTNLQNPMTLARGGFAGLAGLGGTLRTAMSGIGPAVATAAGPLSTLASGGFTRLVAMGGALIPVIRGVGMAMLTLAANPVGMIITALGLLVTAGIAIWQNWDEISAMATQIWNSISGFLGGVMEGITGTFSEVWNGITGFFSGIWDGLLGIVSEAWDMILGVIFPEGGLAGLIAEGWGAITETVGEIWGMVVGTVQEWWDSLMGILFPEEGGLVNMITEAWGGLVEAVSGIWSGVSGGFITGVNAVLGAVEGMANGVIEAINWIITAWNNFELTIGGGTLFEGTPLELNIPDVTIGTPDLPTIPTISIPRLADSSIAALAAGGIVRRPTLALVGEAGPEAVIPLPMGYRRAAMGPPTFNVTMVNRGNIVTDRQLEEVIVRAYHRAVRMGRI